MNEEMNFPVDEHSRILRNRWDAIKTEAENAEKSERRVRGGQTAEYLPWSLVCELLNKVAPDWEMDVNSVTSHYAGDNRAKGFAEAKVTLRILGVSRQDIGISEFGGANNQSEDNARKGAVRLALVRAANLFNIGLDTKSNNQNPNNNNQSGANNKNRNNYSSNQRNAPASALRNNQPLNFEAPKLRAEIRRELRELNLSEAAESVKKIFTEEIGTDSLDKCTDVARLTALKSRIDKKKSGGPPPAAAKEHAKTA
jgi:hypothetical protein